MIATPELAMLLGVEPVIEIGAPASPSVAYIERRIDTGWTLCGLSCCGADHPKGGTLPPETWALLLPPAEPVAPLWAAPLPRGTETAAEGWTGRHGVTGWRGSGTHHHHDDEDETPPPGTPGQHQFPPPAVPLPASAWLLLGALAVMLRRAR